MALLFNRARVSTSTTGTGTVTLGAAIAGYATFAEAGVSDANEVSYVIEDGNDFEIGTGTYTASGTTLSRDTVTLSKISGTAGTSKINLSGNATVFLTARAEDILTSDQADAAFQPLDSDLTAIAALTTTSFGRAFLEFANEAAFKAGVNLEIGTDVQAFDADTLKADTPDTLTAGFAHTPDNDGTQSSGTYTPDQDGGNMKRIVNGGAFTLAPPRDDCCKILQVTYNGSAGAITTSGFTGVFGDSFTTTDGDDFICTIIKINGFSSLTVQDVS